MVASIRYRRIGKSPVRPFCEREGTKAVGEVIDHDGIGLLGGDAGNDRCPSRLRSVTPYFRLQSTALVLTAESRGTADRNTTMSSSVAVTGTRTP